MSDTYKFAVVGGGGVGKSALTLRLVKQQFSDEYDPTIEDSHTKQVEIDGQVAMLEIFDTAGQEELSALRDQALNLAEGFLLVFAVTEENSFKQLEEHYGAIVRAKDSTEVPIVLVGNKCDLSDSRTVSESSIRTLVNKWNVPYFEASAKQDLNVEESFFELVRKMRNAQAKIVSTESTNNVKPGNKKSKCNLL